MKPFEGFATAGIREDGYFSETEHHWLILPQEDWKVHDDGRWLEIGGPGVDGISWALQKEEAGIFAFYPIENRFEWKAKDIEALIAGWLSGEITV